jgi:hypothetical protein
MNRNDGGIMHLLCRSKEIDALIIITVYEKE